MSEAGDEPVSSIPGIEFAKPALRELRKLPARDRDRILERLEAFAGDPSSPQHDVKRLSKSRSLRLKVSDYRVVLTSLASICGEHHRVR